MRSAHTGRKNGTLEPRARASNKRQKWRTTVDYNQFRWGPTWVIYQAVPGKLGHASPHYFSMLLLRPEEGNLLGDLLMTGWSTMVGWMLAKMNVFHY